MTEAPVLTMVIVTRNDLPRLTPTVEGAIESIIGLPVEIVVIDGESTDGTLTFLSGVSASQLRYVCEADSGIYDAMNKGARHARGDYVYFVNCGDEVSGSDAWTTITGDLRTHQPAWLVAQVEHRGGSETTLVPSFPDFDRGRFWLGRQAYNHQGVVFRTQVFNTLGGYDLSYGFMADLHLMLKFSVLAEPRAVGCTIAAYEGGGVSAPLVKKTPRILHRARCELLGLTGLPRRLSGAYAFAQTVRRLGLTEGSRLWRDSTHSFSNPWFPIDERVVDGA